MMFLLPWSNRGWVTEMKHKHTNQDVHILRYRLLCKGFSSRDKFVVGQLAFTIKCCYLLMVKVSIFLERSPISLSLLGFLCWHPCVRHNQPLLDTIPQGQPVKTCRVKATLWDFQFLVHGPSSHKSSLVTRRRENVSPKHVPRGI